MLKLFFIFFLFFATANALEVKCDFEEVYKNGEVQQGFFLIKNNNLRYEYLDKALFKIFYLQNEIYVVENKNTKKINKIDKNNIIIGHLMEVSSNFPNIEEQYNFDNVQIDIEKNITNNFIKRISFKSNKLNMSLYPINCKFLPINNLFFKIQPVVFEYNY